MLYASVSLPLKQEFEKLKRLQTSVSVHPDAIEKTIDDIMELKKINPDINPQLGVSLQACLLQIVGYRNLIVEVEKLRREPYDSENLQHEEMLLKVGLGLVYFAEWDTEVAQQVLSDSLHPKYREYCAGCWPGKGAVCSLGGVLACAICFQVLILKADQIQEAHLYTEIFEITYCYLMHEFHKFWIEEDPLDIMEFNRVREKFHKRILKQLQNPEMALCPHFAASESLINM
uniref:ELMO domain-containing protein n=1 Tax=Pavo cristatus TaxID=9049 RepID=A0A8C9F4U6_PAVCR